MTMDAAQTRRTRFNMCAPSFRVVSAFRRRVRPAEAGRTNFRSDCPAGMCSSTAIAKNPLTAYVFITATMSIVPRRPNSSTAFANVAESTFLSRSIWRPKRMTSASFSSTPVSAPLLRTRSMSFASRPARAPSAEWAFHSRL